MSPNVEVLFDRYVRHDQKLEVVLQLIKLVNIKVTRIMTTLQELPGVLNAMNDKLGLVKTEVGKIGTETQALQTKVQTLTDALNNAGPVSAEVQIALDSLSASVDNVASSVKQVDDLVPDAVDTPPVDTGSTPPPADTSGGSDAGNTGAAQS